MWPARGERSAPLALGERRRTMDTQGVHGMMEP